MEAPFSVDGEEQPILLAESNSGQSGADNRPKGAAQDAERLRPPPYTDEGDELPPRKA
jgi:hypothetical protein